MPTTHYIYSPEPFVLLACHDHSVSPISIDCGGFGSRCVGVCLLEGFSCY